MKRIAVLTSGGDAPGMNAAIRAVTRTGIDLGMEVLGVRRGFAGLVDGEMAPLSARDVGGIIQRGGTILGSARSPRFRTEEGRRQALVHLAERGVEALVIIGGNGSQSGAYALLQMGFPVVGVASTIDNDLMGSDITIGVDTALNVALEAIDRLKNTASSHNRAFVVEVMGRDSGYLALSAGIAGGAETVIIPEVPTDPDAVARELRAAYARGKPHAIVVAAEGASCSAEVLMGHFKSHRDQLGFELRVTILGHVQRGGNPLAFDRLLASRLGTRAAELLSRNENGKLVGLIRGEVTTTPLEEVVGRTKPVDMELYRMANVLAK
ncbi:MAG: 6-phosphofructokinase [Chloroflexota bacterium]